MSADNWNKRYTCTDYVFGTRPSPFLEACRPHLSAGMHGLALADGEGRNGVWLAKQGIDVLALDWSREGLEKARRLAAQRNVRIRTECTDMLTWHYPDGAYDVVCAMNFHFPAREREWVFQSITKTLKPAGLLIFEGIHKDTRDNHDPENLYDEDLLQRLCRGLDIKTMTTYQKEALGGSGKAGKKKICMLATKPDL